MTTFRRFGRRFSVPSTVQILHELRALSAREDARVRCANEDGLPKTARWEDIVAHRTQFATASGSKEGQMFDPTQSRIAMGRIGAPKK
jgi:hypothetical protein